VAAAALTANRNAKAGSQSKKLRRPPGRNGVVIRRMKKKVAVKNSHRRNRRLVCAGLSAACSGVSVIAPTILTNPCRWHHASPTKKTASFNHPTARLQMLL
jgi:hypothetical protein